MKSFIIAGASRSGKTTLAKQLQKETGFSLISADALICTFEHLYPQLEIKHSLEFEKICASFRPFIIEYIEHLRKYQGISFILDIFHLTPETAIQEELHKKYNLVFVGYPNATPEQKLKDIRQFKNDVDDWTDEVEDTEMLKNIDAFIVWSKKLKEECATLGLPFIDTSKDFLAKVEMAYKALLG